MTRQARPVTGRSQRVFTRRYARVYDGVYREKDYIREAQLIHRAIQKYRPGATRLIELGTGTGGHARYLAQWYRMRCFERSGPMLAVARPKLEGLPVTLTQADIRNVPTFGSGQDAVISVFHVLNYLTGPELRAVVARVVRSLAPGGVFLFDSWNAAAVLRQRPTVRRRRFRIGSVELSRVASPELDWVSSDCVVNIDVNRQQASRDSSLVAEAHRIHYYLPNELREMLNHAGLSVRSISNDLGHRLAMDDWSMRLVATKEDGKPRPRGGARR